MSSSAPLPRWDLSDLYPAHDAPELTADFETLEAKATAFAEAYQGRVAGLGAEGLAEAICDYEALSELEGRIGSYAQLVYATDTADTGIGRFYQQVCEKLSALSSKTLFFTLEVNRIGEDELAEWLTASQALARYKPWLETLRRFLPYQLPDAVEKVVHEQHVTGAGAWVRLFDQTMAELRFPVNGKDLTFSETANMLSSAKRDARKAAANGISETLGNNIRLLCYITNTLAKDKALADDWRGYEAPWSRRNLSNQVEDTVVGALVATVRKNYPAISHRYYKLKARWFGLDKLAHYDRNAPLPDASDRHFTWDQARDTVLGAYGDFAPELADLGRKFFDNAWIDAPPYAGKNAGAFAHPTVPSAHPYLLVNYHGKARDVMTLAHELGHGVHQLLAAEQGYFLSGTPLTLAETASVFGEMLTFRAMLRAETDPKNRKILLAAKVEDMINTVIRQTAFFEFEQQVHIRRRDGELSPEDFTEIWMEVQRASLGPALDLVAQDYGHYWSYIPHFIHTPFYVYAYAFGDCLVNALYDVYSGADTGFQQKYFDMLRAGGTLRHKELLAPFGLDAGDPAFWQRGLNVIIGFIDELEALEKG